MSTHRAELVLERDDGDRLHFSRRYRAQGCVSLLLGVFLILLGLGAMEGVWAIMGVPILLFGAVIFAGAFRSFVRLEDLHLDLGTRRLTRRSGFWPVARWTTRSLDAVKEVSRTVEERAVDDEGGTELVHLVTLRFTGEEPVVIRAALGATEAYGLAERLARVTGADEVDRTGPAEVRRAPEHLDESLAGRWTRGGGHPDPAEPIPDPPASSPIELREVPSRARITLPRRIAGTDWVAILVAGAAALWLLGAVLSGMTTAERLGASDAMAVAVGLVFAVLLVFGVRTVGSSVVIEEDGDHIRLRWEFAGRTVRRSSLAKDEIEAATVYRTPSEIRDSRPGRIRIRTDDGVSDVGRHLTPDEVEWLEEAVTTLAVRR